MIDPLLLVFLIPIILSIILLLIKDNIEINESKPKKCNKCGKRGTYKIIDRSRMTNTLECTNCGNIIYENYCDH